MMENKLTSLVIFNKTMAENQGCVVIGREGDTTGDYTIVLAAGKDNQLKFLKDGRIFHNDRELKSDDELKSIMKNVAQALLNQFSNNVESRH